MKYFKIIIETNILLALAAVFLSAGSALQFGVAPKIWEYFIVIFFGTFLAYNMNQLPGLIQNKKVSDEGYTKWVRENKLVFCSIFFFALLGVILSGYFLEAKVQLALVPVAIVSVLYSFPAFHLQRRSYSLREIPFVKIFLIVIVWSVTTVVLPAVQMDVSWKGIPVLLVFAERFIFLFALAILFDVRDMELDKRSRLKTIPVIMGKRNSILASIGLLFLFFAISLIHYASFSPILLPAFIISTFITFIFIMYTRLKPIPYFHYRLFDGTLLFQPLLVFIFYYLGKTTL